MRKLKNNIIDLYNLLEAKDHIIDRLNLTDEQKTELKSFFKAHPNYENKIDWNKKDLTYDDFKAVLALEGKSKSQAKKNGIAGLKEGEDYQVIAQENRLLDFDYIIYRPLTHLGSKILASNLVYPYVTGQWCIAMNSDNWWSDYIHSGYDFFFLCITRKDNPKEGYKFAISRKTTSFFNQVSEIVPKGLNTNDTYTMNDFPSHYEFSHPEKIETLSLKKRLLFALDNAVGIFNAQDQSFALFDLFRNSERLLMDKLLDKPAYQMLLSAFNNYLLTALVNTDNTILKDTLAKKDLLIPQIFTPAGKLNKDIVLQLSDLEKTVPFRFDLKFPASYSYSFFPDEGTYEEELFDGSWDGDYDDGVPGSKKTTLWLGSIAKVDMSRTKVHTILEGAFSNLPITEFIPSPSLRFIGQSAFSGCSDIKELDFSNLQSLHIEAGAFSYMYGLKTIKLPHDIELEYDMFQMDTNLEEIQYDGTLEEFLDQVHTEWKITQPKDNEDLRQIIDLLFSGTYRGINVTISCKDQDLDLNGKWIWEEANPEKKLNLLRKRKELEKANEEAIPF